MTSPSTIRSLFLNGPAGRLEALLNEGAPTARYSALVAHPHPLYGGTMHNKVVFHAMKALNSFGIPVLRFNFRGAGASAGEHDKGRGEVEDVRTALDWLHTEFNLPILFCGFSFGAAVGVPAACPDVRVPAFVILGIPISAEGRRYSYDALLDCRKPKVFVSGELDQYAPAAMLRELFDSAAEPKRAVLIPEADHFFAGHLDEMSAAIRQWVSEVALTAV
jgi:alpha/beta superfamily hydrolase